MGKKQVKFVVASAVIVLAVGYLMITGISKTSVYYLTVAELIERKDVLYDEGVRVQGKVVGGTIEKNTKGLELLFDMADEKDPSFAITVDYKGITPDLFEADREVIVEGIYTKNNIFKATTLLTSCPSKYEASEIEKSQKGEKT